MPAGPPSYSGDYVYFEVIAWMAIQLTVLIFVARGEKRELFHAPMRPAGARPRRGRPDGSPPAPTGTPASPKVKTVITNLKLEGCDHDTAG